MTVPLVIACLVGAWLVGAVAVGLLVAQMVRLRDRQVPRPNEVAGEESISVSDLLTRPAVHKVRRVGEGFLR